MISYSLQGGKEVTVKKNVTLKPGLNKIHIPLDIQNPVRWMPNGWGEPHLYDFSAQVICDGKTIASLPALHRTSYDTGGKRKR